MADKASVPRNIRFRPDNWEKIKQLSERYDRSASWVVNDVFKRLRQAEFDTDPVTREVTSNEIFGNAIDAKRIATGTIKAGDMLTPFHEVVSVDGVDDEETSG